MCWIKINNNLDKNPKTLATSRKCNASVTLVCGCLVRMWAMADENADENGTILGMTADDLDQFVGVPGFAIALPPQWIELGDDFVKFPKYQEHNGATAKKRAQTNKRVTQLRYKNVTREEKRREDKIIINTPPTPQGERNLVSRKNSEQEIQFPKNFDNDQCKTAWADWLEHKKSRKENYKSVKSQEIKLKELEKLLEGSASRFISAINSSIGNNYAGIFEPKQQNGQIRPAIPEPKRHHPPIYRSRAQTGSGPPVAALVENALKKLSN